MGDKKITLASTEITEVKKWIAAIQASRANVKEQARSRLPTVKNLYWILKLKEQPV
jgi:hypothetical protein